jgi:hypothetical protein
MVLAVCVCVCVCVCVFVLQQASYNGTDCLVSQERLMGRDFGAWCDRVFLSVSLLLTESATAAAAAAAAAVIILCTI